ncbi:EF-hand domain-containing protein [Pannonibacter tanglangensis]|uniref:Calcium-binding protein n=1 Tax=Pannonibacter tanglangensis TaxID=2750084 RepID=A0ABW9ZJS8_9HYPH|nr:EF-hand domain-containing protein [Pannonibacter sp. XCT-34]NBN62985.1 calcium-binding protein [Pannonibacter sp. XCT-34]
MKTLRTIALASVAATLTLVAAGAVLADDGGMGWGGRDRGGPRMMLEQFDLDKDGALTQDEVSRAATDRFTRADANTDGKVTLDEFRAFRLVEAEPMRIRAFQRLDRDGDGKVTREEFDTLSARLFARLDRDDDGTLAMVPMGPRGGGEADDARGRGPDRGHDRGGMMGRGAGGPMMAGLFDRFDTDADGKVSREEFDRVRGELFAKADPAGSGAFDLTGFGAIFADLGEPRLVRMFQDLDANGDLAITAEENAARTAGLVGALDANEDGVVTRADFRKMKRDGRHGKDERGNGRHHAQAGENGPGHDGKGPHRPGRGGQDTVDN